MNIVTFDLASLRSSSFEGTTLEEVRFLNSQLERCSVAGCLFLNCDVSPFADGATMRSFKTPVLDWRSVCRSLRSADLIAFLTRNGMPEVMAIYIVESARALDPELLFKLMRSTFIGYGAPDVDFARELRNRLQMNGVSTFFSLRRTRS